MPPFLRCVLVACAALIAFNRIHSAVAQQASPEPTENVTQESETTFSEGEKLFALHVQPLISEKCLACHGADQDAIEGGLDLRNRESMLAGGDNFEDKVLVPGNAGASALFRTAKRSEEGYEMPPKEAEALSQEQYWHLRDWINAGAPWPNEQRSTLIRQQFDQGIVVDTSKALSDDWQFRRYEAQNLWAYRPLQKVSVPNNAHPIDYLIDQSLKQAELPAAGQASATTIARRLSFGLTGLPPQVEAADAFVQQYRNDPGQAINDYAQQLMASPHYGEHFAQRWLDVVRYADTAGFANDYSRPNAWRYRDYVIRAFQNDVPFNTFVQQQLAGDELDDRKGENLIATGFLRMGPWEQTSMSVFKETRQQWLDDITDTVGQAFLGHALQCAKCHDHKFDPVPTRDYYRMMAVFSTTQFAERDVAFLSAENQANFANSDNWVNEKIQAYQQQSEELNQQVSQKREQETGDAKVGDNGLAPGDEASLARMNKNMQRHRLELDRTKPIALTVYTGKTIQYRNVSTRLLMPANPWNKGQFDTDAILAGGNIYSPTDPVMPGALSAAESLGNMNHQPFPASRGKRRLALARWITSPDNPLTARVIVNRVWSWHFGSGLAGNPNNFGATGAAPTHGPLLDYLARWFMDNDWSVRKLNQLIVSSRVYRRNSTHPHPELVAQRDSQNKLYAVFQPRRLTAEEIRDAMLACSGELNRQVGGISCRPDLNLEVAFQPRQIMGGTASVYEPDPLPSQRNRRTIYAEKIRGLRDPFMETFNQPGPDKSCELRETSIIAPQALTLLNSEEVLQRAIAMADQLIQRQATPKETIRQAFEICLGRQPDEAETMLCLQHWRQHAALPAPPEPTAIADQLQRTVMAEKTGQPYSFVEHMPAYKNYQADLQPADVSATTRGLATVCLVLFNSNEFLYLD